MSDSKNSLNRSRTTSKATLPVGGIDHELILCLEAFEKWMESQLWLYEYDSAKAAWMGAWFMRKPKRD